VPELEPVRVQELPLETEVVADAVLGVARDGEIHSSQMDTDLMRSTRLQPDVEQCVLGRQLDDLEVRDGLARLVGVERPPRRIATIPADRRVDPAGPGARSPTDESEIAPLDFATAYRLL
jgi:hypothetical protein